jgi:hypothetical protein
MSMELAVIAFFKFLVCEGNYKFKIEAQSSAIPATIKGTSLKYILIV